MTRADGVRSSRVAHGAMGTQGSNWRVGNPHGGHTRRAGALDRLVNGLGGWLGHVRREAPGAGSRAHADLAWRTKVGRREYLYQLAGFFAQSQAKLDPFWALFGLLLWLNVFRVLETSIFCFYGKNYV